ncbi:UTRA domain-containing protein [Pantoea sp. KPR_PJ]
MHLNAAVSWACHDAVTLLPSVTLSIVPTTQPDLLRRLPNLCGWPTLQHVSSGSLHDLLMRQGGHQLMRSQTRISTRRAQAKECRLLDTGLHAPLLCVRTLNKTRDGTLAEYAVSLTRGDITELTLEH